MVATRRGTRVEPREEGESGAAEPTPMEDSSPNSPKRTRTSVRKDGQTVKNNVEEGESSPLKSDAETHNTQMSTRSKSRYEQLDTESLEVKITSSNTTTRSHSRQSLGQLTDSTRKLKNRPSALITEPPESKEDAELSEAESHCSSVSTTASRRQPQTASCSVSTRSRKSVFPSEPTSDVSEAESTSSISGVKMITTRSTRSSRTRHPSSLVSEPLKEPTSDAESCSSGFSLRPIARRSSRTNPSNSQLGEVVIVSENNKDDAQDQETLKKQSLKAQRVKSDDVLSSPRRSLRNPPTIPEDEVVIVSNDEPESGDTVPDVLAVEQPEVDQSSATKDESQVEGSAVSSLQSSENKPEEPDQLLKLSEDSMDEEPASDKHTVTIDNDATGETNQDLQESAQMAESMNINLFLDSDSEKSEDNNDMKEDHYMEEEEEDVVVEKPKSKKSSTSQIQDVAGDGLFVIDTAPAVDHIKQYFLELEDNDDELFVKKEEPKKQSKSVELDGPSVIDTAPAVDPIKQYFLDLEDDDDDDELLVMKQEPKKQSKSVELDVMDTAPAVDSFKQYFMELKDDDDELFVKKRKSKKKPKRVELDGLFVIDTAPGVDASKKYYLEPEASDKEDEPEAIEKGEISGPEDDDDFIDEDEGEDVDEEENLLNSSKSKCFSTSIDTGIDLKKMGGLYINFDAAKRNPGPSLLSKMKGIKKKDELLQKSVITPDFEKKESVPPYSQSKRKLKQLRKAERDKSTGKGWFDMKAPDITPELKNDLKALKMRAAMDPKRFYKKNDREGFPKYFQVGTIVDNPADFFHSRVPKKQRKRTIVEELLADSEFRRYNKKKYMEIVAEKAARAAGKKNRKKKKFQN